MKITPSPWKQHPTAGEPVLPTSMQREATTTRCVAFIVIAGWVLCLIVAAVVCRALYADGAYAVLELLRNPMHYIDYDVQRSFASYITQTPVLVGQRLGAARVSTYAALYSLGVFVLPATLFLVALWIARRVSVLFAITAAAIVVFGFGANFINSEANLFLGSVWLAAIILALPGSHPLLRGVALPMIAFGLLRIYEGMLLVGPVLALWAFLAMRPSQNLQEKIGLTVAIVLFTLGTLIGFGGLIAPRDPSNASGFVHGAFAYFRNPQFFVFLSALFSLVAMMRRVKRDRWIWIVAAVLLAVTFIWKMVRQEGYYAYSLYYSNRSFLVFLLPAILAALLAVFRFRPEWISQPIRIASLMVTVVPLCAVMAIDLLGSARWFQYMADFCVVLDHPASATGGVAQLQQSGAVTGWGWTHPTMSVLLRERGNFTLVRNEPGQGFDPTVPISIDYRGVCENSLFANSRSASSAVHR